MSITSVMPAAAAQSAHRAGPEPLGSIIARHPDETRTHDPSTATRPAAPSTDDHRSAKGDRPAELCRHSQRTIARAVVAAVLAILFLAPGYGLADEPDGPRRMGLLWLPDAPVLSASGAVVIALYDTTGIDPRGWRYAEQLTAAGIAVLHVDLQDTAAEDGGPVAAVGDTVAVLARLGAVLDTLAEDPRFANATVGIIAFGGAGRAAALAAADPRLGTSIAAVVLLYPGCAALKAIMQTQESGPRAPILLLHGGSDPANSPADCVDLAAHFGRTAPVRRVQYAGAGYAWDLPPSGQFEAVSLPWPGRVGPRLPVHYWPGGAELSATQAASFFAAMLRRGERDSR